MKILKIILIFLGLIAIYGFQDEAKKEKAQIDKRTDIVSKERRVLIDNRLPAGSKLILAPGGNPDPALCCGCCGNQCEKPNNSGWSCQNCATLHPFSTCMGTIKACPDGEIITDSGLGDCNVDR
ncbi:hypothetical protein [uncultured Microbulbifer sp.]|uniref:hypothetical protein n=1 Tax=uncultured Microbulbifer sp. TaxID=348147 RepID=UPI0026166581|nr:hypothetical protein [uncultured Microbulbifer sp.]